MESAHYNLVYLLNITVWSILLKDVNYIILYKSYVTDRWYPGINLVLS